MSHVVRIDPAEYSSPGTQVLLLPTGRELPVRKGAIDIDAIKALSAEEADALDFYTYRVRRLLSPRVKGYSSVHRAMTWIHHRCIEHKQALGQPAVKFRRCHEVRGQQ